MTFQLLHMYNKLNLLDKVNACMSLISNSTFKVFLIKGFHEVAKVIILVACVGLIAGVYW